MHESAQESQDQWKTESSQASMVRGLLILNSSYAGSRDMWFPRVARASRGYNIYRAFDAPYNFVKINQTGPVPGQFFRDSTQLARVKYTVQPGDWIDPGTVTGNYIIRIPDTPYSDIVQGKPVVSSSPDDVLIKVIYQDGTTVKVRPAQVQGIDQTIYLPNTASLPVGGAVTNLPQIDFPNVASYEVHYSKLLNYVDIAANMTRTYYRIIPVGDRGELHDVNDLGVETVNSFEVDRMDYIQREMVRRNEWVRAQVAEPAYLMFRRRSGEPCGCTTTETGTPRTRCEVCFETGVVGGYYGPYDFPYLDPDTANSRTLDEGGIKVERPSRSGLGPTPIVQDGDMVVRRNGERLVISGCTYITPRGVLLQQEFDTSLLAPGDTRYLIPIADPRYPIIYNPVEDDPLDGKGGAEPIYQANTVPGRTWDNERPPIGRTVVFGRILGN